MDLQLKHTTREHAVRFAVQVVGGRVPTRRKSAVFGPAHRLGTESSGDDVHA